MVAKLKLKGIDGRAPPGVEPAAQFDSTRGLLPGPDIVNIQIDSIFLILWWWCMAVLSWWSDLYP